MVRAKKHLGQHFLQDDQVAEQIVEFLTGFGDYQQVLEIGPGTGVLTQHLLRGPFQKIWMIDVDREATLHLKKKFPEQADQIIHQDFLQFQAASCFQHRFGIVGNLPYNISSQIFFKILDIREMVPECVCMIQKEVAQRLVSPPGNRAYGILSVFLQAFYKLEYLLEVPPESFYPVPKVESAVIRLQTLGKTDLGCDQKIFRAVVKQGFQNRRKTLRNALKAFNLPLEIRSLELLDKRAEQLAVEDYVTLTKTITPFWNP
jgi:16S rRNA (adenine1518-N6/adenine1519-N6)-dimethyltransferase